MVKPAWWSKSRRRTLFDRGSAAPAAHFVPDVSVLAAQRCYNDLHLSFRREAENTEIPHLFEHLLLEIQKQVRRGIVNLSPMSGETEWNWTIDPRGRFHVTVGYDNEIVALASIRLAERIMRALDTREIGEIDIEREMKRLRELAKASRRFIAPLKSAERDCGDETLFISEKEGEANGSEAERFSDNPSLRVA